MKKHFCVLLFRKMEDLKKKSSQETPDGTSQVHILAQSTNTTTAAAIGTESPHGPFTLENVTKETGGSLTLVESKDDGRLFLIIFNNF